MDQSGGFCDYKRDQLLYLTTTTQIVGAPPNFAQKVKLKES